MKKKLDHILKKKTFLRKNAQSESKIVNISFKKSLLC